MMFGGNYHFRLTVPAIESRVFVREFHLPLIASWPQRQTRELVGERVHSGLKFDIAYGPSPYQLPQGVVQRDAVLGVPDRFFGSQHESHAKLPRRQKRMPRALLCFVFDAPFEEFRSSWPCARR